MAIFTFLSTHTLKMFAFAQKKGMVYKNYQIFVQEVYKRASLHLLMQFGIQLDVG